MKYDSEALPFPRLKDLGNDLLELSYIQKITTLALPFLFSGIYFLLAAFDYWFLAVFSLMCLSFVTYGSTSHDLVHKNLRINKTTNEFLLFLIELLTIRSGHAYKLAHLHHHARYPNDDDIEGAASKMSFMRTLLEGIIFQVKIYLWAIKNVKKVSDRRWILVEGILCIAIIIFSLLVYNFASIFLIYVLLMVMGSWIIPLITSYIPHRPMEKNPLFQTRLFRGKVLSIIAFQHLYHIEHHMYPQVPHMKWPQLAKRLDSYFEKSGVKPYKLWF